MTVNEMDRGIVGKLVDDALSTGHVLSVFDGAEWTLKKSADRTTILGAMFSTGEDALAVWKDGVKVGTVDFIYGNSGWDVIHDYTDNAGMKALLSGAEKLADEYERVS